MNKIIIYSFIVLSVFNSCKSNEDKANKLIKDDMFKTLYDFSSYEPIETIVDSAYTSMYSDSLIVLHAFGANMALKKARENLEDLKSAEKSMEIWRPNSYSSNYAISQYKEALNEYKEKLGLATSYLAMSDSLSKLVVVQIKDFKPEFIGWEAKHKFRCKNKGGNFSLGDYSYIIDPKFLSIIRRDDLDDETFAEVKVVIDDHASFFIDESTGDLIRE